MEYQEHVQTLRTAEPRLADEVAGFRTLESVMSWMGRRGISLASIEIIFQDEFSHDFLVPLDAAGRHLVFGIT